jgi:hypothetical protein
MLVEPSVSCTTQAINRQALQAWLCYRLIPSADRVPATSEQGAVSETLAGLRRSCGGCPSGQTSIKKAKKGWSWAISSAA